MEEFKIAIVVPAYNEELTLPIVINELEELKKLPEVILDPVRLILPADPPEPEAKGPFTPPPVKLAPPPGLS